MAETLIFLQENQFDSLEQLQHESDTISKQIDNLSDQKNNLQDQIADLNKKIHYLGQYHVNKKYFSSMLKSGNKADYRKTHSDKIAQYDEARNFLKSVYPDSDYPDLNQLKNQRKQILTDYKSLNSDIHDLYKQNQKLKIVSHNSQELLSHKQVISRENLHLQPNNSFIIFLILQCQALESLLIILILLSPPDTFYLIILHIL